MKALPLHIKIFIGMTLGITGGLILQYSGASSEQVQQITTYIKPVGDISCGSYSCWSSH
jgi:Na+/H+-dicarboxylate symporter